MEDVFENYRQRVEKFDRTLGKQHTGAASATVGFDFQEMVCGALDGKAKYEMSSDR